MVRPTVTVLDDEVSRSCTGRCGRGEERGRRAGNVESEPGLRGDDAHGVAGGLERRAVRGAPDPLRDTREECVGRIAAEHRLGAFRRRELQHPAELLRGDLEPLSGDDGGHRCGERLLGDGLGTVQVGAGHGRRLNSGRKLDRLAAFEGCQRCDHDLRRSDTVEPLSRLTGDHADVQPLPHEAGSLVRTVDLGCDHAELVVDRRLVRADLRRDVDREEPEREPAEAADHVHACALPLSLRYRLRPLRSHAQLVGADPESVGTCDEGHGHAPDRGAASLEHRGRCLRGHAADVDAADPGAGCERAGGAREHEPDHEQCSDNPRYEGGKAYVPVSDRGGGAADAGTGRGGARAQVAANLIGATISVSGGGEEGCPTN